MEKCGERYQTTSDGTNWWYIFNRRLGIGTFLKLYIFKSNRCSNLKARHAESQRVDSLLCLPDLYYKPKNAQQLVDYLKLIGEAAPNTPLLYYHIPSFTNVNSKSITYTEVIFSF